MTSEIERDHPVAIFQALDLELELLGRLGKAVKQDKRLSGAGLKIVQSNTVTGPKIP